MDQLRVLRVVTASPRDVKPEPEIISRVGGEVNRTVTPCFVVRRLCRLKFALLLGALLCAASGVVWAESGVLVVHVEDVQRRPISGVQIGAEGDGGSQTTGDDGKARIPLAKETKEKSWISLQILKSPPHNDFVMVSPWDYRAVVPLFENESENFVKVVVVQRGDRMVLESGVALAALTAQINKANAPKTADKQAPQEDPRASLAAVAKMYGVDPDDLDKAIRSWGVKTTDPYEMGQAALYERNYAKASAQLADSLRGREEKLARDQRAVADDVCSVADAACFLGYSLYEEGKYLESSTAFRRCLQFRPEDDWVLNYLALSLHEASDYAAAEPLYRRVLAFRQQTMGVDHLLVANSLNNLAGLLETKGDYAGAEPLFRRALAIDEKALGPDHPTVATGLNNLAAALLAKGDYAGAEPLFRRALAIYEKALGPDEPLVATALGNLAETLRAKGDYAGAEPLYRRALAIDEKSLGPNHPDVAWALNNLALILHAKGDYAGAESLFRRALAMNEKVLGPDHPLVATALDNLAETLRAKSDYAGAEPLYRRALAIREKALGPNHPDVALVLNNLAILLATTGNNAGAEPLWRRALAIDEQTLGPNHPTTKLTKRNLQVLIDEEAAKKTEK
jgi:tetratricopeptide (TPR) repeat protein